jgi:hypothetical protein
MHLFLTLVLGGGVSDGIRTPDRPAHSLVTKLTASAQLHLPLRIFDNLRLLWQEASSSAEVKNAWSYTSLPTCLHDMVPN